MATLKAVNTTQTLLLNPFHRFGRLADSVETLLHGRETSRIHAIIEWHQDHWEIRDLSKNGIWLNNELIPQKQPIKLNVNDRVQFSQSPLDCFTVLNDNPPCSYIENISETVESNSLPHLVIELSQYHLLPDEDNAEIIVYYDNFHSRWYYESTNDHQAHELNDAQTLHFDKQYWKFSELKPDTQEQTIDIGSTQTAPMKMTFNLSQDEETTEIEMTQGNITIDLQDRTHHYLTLLLARYKGADLNNNVDIQRCGWVELKQLMRDLGLSESHINIQIHRARKQLAEKLSALNLHGPMLIERKKGQVRLACRYFEIYKGKQLEMAFMPEGRN